MLNNLSHLYNATVTASDGPIGLVKGAYFDDQSWTVRYLVVETGTWLSGRDVLISPYAVRQPLDFSKNIDVALTRQRVQDSPGIDMHKPVSRQHESETLRYYGYPEYWLGGGVWGMHGVPLMPSGGGPAAPPAGAAAVHGRDPQRDDAHLRSSTVVAGYHIMALDQDIGHVDDFIFDDESWTIRYLVVDPRNWWPGGRKVLVGTRWISRIDWTESNVHVTLTREQVKASPDYQETVRIARDYEQRLHDAYSLKGYWASAQPPDMVPIGIPPRDTIPSPVPALHVFETHREAESAIRALSKAGVDLRTLSLVGKGYHTEEQPLGFYTRGDRIKAWGGAGAFWGGMWGLLFAPAMFLVPGVGVLAMAGPVVATFVAALEGAVVVGGLSALGAALTQLGVLRDQAIKYETAVKADKFVLMVHGTVEDAAGVDAVLDDTRTWQAV